MYDPTKPYIKQIHDLIRPTWRTPYLDVREGIYATFEKKFSYPEVDHTDGIGTKGMYHWGKKTLHNAVLDSLAMNLNDLLLVGAQAYKLQNHIIIPEDDRVSILKIIEVLARECKKRKIALTGGETSIHNNADGIDISISVSGFIKKPFKNEFQIGDVLIGLSSSGLHSNGFTKIRELFGTETRDEFITPTRIYYDELLPVLAGENIHGMMHITGGAYTKLKSILPENAEINIKRNHPLKPQNIFHEIYKRGVNDDEIYKTFNCGVGFVLSTPPENAEKILAQLTDGAIIGEVRSGTGKIKVQSAFSEKVIIL